MNHIIHSFAFKLVSSKIYVLQIFDKSILKIKTNTKVSMQ